MTVMRGQKVIDKKTTKEQKDMLRLKKTVDGLAKAGEVRWYKNVLRRNDNSDLRIALDLKVSGIRERPKKT